LIRKLIVAMVAAAMLVAMAIPAFAQGPEQLAANLGLLNVGNFSALAQECKQANVAIAHQEQKNTSIIGQEATGSISQDGLVNVNEGDVNVDQTAVIANNQEANPEQTNVCVAAVDQEFDLFGDEEPNGPPNNGPPNNGPLAQP
jgi:hypothetical protein